MPPPKKVSHKEDKIAFWGLRTLKGEHEGRSATKSFHSTLWANHPEGSIALHTGLSQYGGRLSHLRAHSVVSPRAWLDYGAPADARRLTANASASRCHGATHDAQDSHAILGTLRSPESSAVGDRRRIPHGATRRCPATRDAIGSDPPNALPLRTMQQGSRDPYRSSRSFNRGH
jgi:hypothetical protein